MNEAKIAHKDRAEGSQPARDKIHCLFRKTIKTKHSLLVACYTHLQFLGGKKVQT